MRLILCAAFGFAVLVLSCNAPGRDACVKPADSMTRLLNLTPQQQADLNAWLNSHSGPAAKPSELAKYLDANLDPARRALLDVLMQMGQAPRNIPQPSLVLDESVNDQIVYVQPGQYLAIALPANATTGYQWSVQSIRGEGLKAEGKMQYYADARPAGQPPRVGAGGAAAQVFLATQPGAASVTLAYARPFEKDKKPEKTVRFRVQADAPGPLSATLFAKQTTYKLRDDLAGKTEKQLKGRNGQPQPAPPAVDIQLAVTNTSDQPVTLMRGADAEQIIVELTGPGAVTVPAMVMMTMEFRMGKPTKIAPGETFKIDIEKLAFGMRGISRYAYWTQPGQYTLTVRYQGAMAKPDGQPGQTRRTMAVTPPIQLRITR